MNPESETWKPPEAERPAWNRRTRRERQERRERAAAAQTGERSPPDFIPKYYAWIFAGGVALLIGYFDLINPNHKPTESLCLASLVFGVACLPMGLFLRRGQNFQVPVLEAHGLFYALCFGLPGFLALPEVSAAFTVDESDMQQALLATLFGLIALLTGYYLAGSELFRQVRPAHPGRNISLKTFEWLAWTGCAGALALKAVLHYVPALGFLGQVTAMIYKLGFFGLLLLTLERRAGLTTQLVVWLVLLPFALVMESGLSNGQLAGAVTLICWISLAVMRTRKRIPVELLAAAFLFFLILQPVKFYVREIAWGEGIKMGPVQTFNAYVQGFKETYGSTEHLWVNQDHAFNNSFTRINHLSTTAAIIRDTPARQPFIWGSSYVPLLTKWIPRAVWADKPEEQFGNDWARRYGYLGENDTTTSFNLPWLPEMFMNFGWYGVVGIMFLLGILYRYLWLVMMKQSRLIPDYALALVLAQSLIFTESNLSLQLGSVIIMVMALWFLLFFLKFTGIKTASTPHKRKPAPASPS